MSFQQFVGLRISTQAGSVPTAAQIGEGELAFNVADRKIYVRFGSNIDDITDRYTRQEVDALTSELGERLDDLQIGDVAGLLTALAGKVNKEDGKGLSDRNYTQAEKDKLASVGTLANRAVFISDLPPDDVLGQDGDIWLQHWS